LTNGRGRVAVYFEACADVEARNMRLDGFQGGGTLSEACLDVRYDNIRVNGIDPSIAVVEGTNSGFTACYFSRTRRGTATRIRGLRVRHVIDSLDAYEITGHDCRGINTHRAAFTSHEGVFDLGFSKCRSVGCYGGALIRAFTAAIEGCDFMGYAYAISTGGMLASEGQGTLSIKDCPRLKIDGLGTVFETAVVINGVYERFEFSNSHAKAAHVAIYFQTPLIKNVIINGGSLSAATPIEIAYPTGSENLDYFRGFKVHGTEMLDYTGSMIKFRGSELITAPADIIRLIDITGIPVSEGSGGGFDFSNAGWYGENVLVRGCGQPGDSSAVMSPPSQPYRWKAAPIVEQNDEFNTANRTHRIIGRNTSASWASGGTVLKGQRLLRTQPNTATTGEWIVTTSGTEGTLTGVTSSIDVGVSTTTVNLTGNAIDKVYPGCYLTINGAGAASANLATRVTSVAADYSSCTIETAASTTVSGATTAYRAPVFTVYATTS
jgi:hypothetical protein